MHVILWEFQTKDDHEEEFERAYGPEGEWARFFEHGEGYLGTELLADRVARGRYVTIDRWASQSAYESFRAQRAAEYQELDRRFEALTEREAMLGSFLTLARD